MHKKSLIVIFLILSILCGCSKIEKSEALDIDKNTSSSEVTLTPAQMKNDLDSLKTMLTQVHPDTYNKYSRKAFDEKVIKLYEKIQRPLSIGEFYIIAQSMASLVNDPHTSIHPDKSFDYLPISLFYSKDGLFVVNDNDLLRDGDKILSIGGKSVNEITNELRKVFAYQNEDWLRVLVQANVNKKCYLEYLGLLDNNKVKFDVQSVDGRKRTVYTDYFVKGTTANEQKKKYVTYKIYNNYNLGVITINSFIKDENDATWDFDEKIDSFFSDVQSNHITRIAFDIRQNTGGDLANVYKLLGKININSINDYNLIKNIKTDKYINLKNYTPKAETNTRKIEHESNSLYNGDIYVLTSKITFSAATMFATIIKDNNLGTVIGEPTGMSPTAYGPVQYFELKNSKLKYQLSYGLSFRPNKLLNRQPELIPDKYIPITIEDIIADKDPAIEWLINKNKK